ncbi:MAG: Fic family protein [candidate division WWE3 bacterium]|nr:Fic family protein [candidate division WWE3 bacterium]
MRIPPAYEKTIELTRNLARLQSASTVLAKIPLSPIAKTNYERTSLLHSALFSARIEGNDLDLTDLTTSSQAQKQVEVQNLQRALKYLQVKWAENSRKSIDLALILALHKLVMAEVSQYPIGKLRNNVSAIFNGAGFAIYVPPAPSVVPGLLNDLISYINSKEDAIILAFLGHLVFEKIHPFFDGNGRVGRLLLKAVLLKEGYEALSFVSLEEAIDGKRDEYYSTFTSSATRYLEFMSETLATAAEKAIDQLLQSKEESPKELALLPRRQEILNIIRDHGAVNFDTLHRRFLAINPRTLRYDIKYLIDHGFVQKQGTTRGVFYSLFSHTGTKPGEFDKHSGE